MSDDWYQFEVPDFTSIECQTFVYVHYKHILLYVLALYIHPISIKNNYSAKKSFNNILENFAKILTYLWHKIATAGKKYLKNRTLTYAAPLLWNKLPVHLQLIDSTTREYC